MSPVREAIDDLRGERLKRWLRDRSVAVLGLGRSGISAASCLVRAGSNVFLSESQHRRNLGKGLPDPIRHLRSEYGGHTRTILEQDFIILSPGVDRNLKLLDQARQMRIPVWSELELGWRLVPSGKTVAVTGTNGKTTTVSLLADMCKRSGMNTLLAGNIGNPLCDFAFRREDFDMTVLEVSSYQLEETHRFHPDIAVVLNVSEDHLHRHGTMAGYAATKARIFRNQEARDAAVLNSDDPWCRNMGRHVPSRVVWFSASRSIARGVFHDEEGGWILSRIGNAKRSFLFPKPAHLPGLHNIENSAAAIACASLLRLPASKVRDSLLGFKGVAHRLETVGRLDGVTFVNDSKSTNVDSTLKAIQSYAGPLWLILGGEDKGSPYVPLRKPVRERVKGIFLIGEASSRIHSQLKGACPITFSRSLGPAVRESARRAVTGDTILLSPACASFDQFENYEDRGDRFKELIRHLKR